MRIRALASAFLLLLCSSLASAWELRIPETLDLRLSGLQYPYLVHEISVPMGRESYPMVYMDVAKPSPPRGTVLLMHGKNFSSEYWALTIEALAEAGYRVIAIDQIGFGRSAKPDIPYHFDDLVKNTVMLLDTLGISKVTVVANSMGGMLGVHFASLHPERLVSLVLENPLGLEDYSAIPSQSNERLLALEMAQTEETYRKFLQGYFPVWRDAFGQYARLYGAIKKGPDYPAFSMASVRSYQMIAEHPVVSEFKDIQAPVLLVIGQLDRTVFGKRFAPPETVKSMGDFPALGQAAAQAFPHAKLIRIDDCGHVPHLENPERFNRELIQFLSSVHGQ